MTLGADPMMTRYTPSRRSAIDAILVLILAGGATGCGRPPGTVSGRVFYRDQPLKSGSVVLYCEGSQIVRGQIGPDGTYAIPNVPRGEVRVTVVPPVRMPEGFRMKFTTPPVIDGPIMPQVGGSVAEGVTIPLRYSMPEESGLSLKIDRSETEFDIRLVP
jgi:hypothetical protein